MRDWLKGLILLVMGNILYEVVPVWITEYLLAQPNPLYSIGLLLESFPLYLFVKDLYKKS